MEATLSTFAATLFALLNPLGMLPVFIGYTDGLNAGVQRWLALLVTLTVLGLMILFLLTGNNILHFFGITLDAFRMAGGIILLLIGINIVNATPNQKTTASVTGGVGGDLGEAESVYRMIVVPFAMPLLVGPGVIANLILYAAEAKNSGRDEMFPGLLGVSRPPSCTPTDHGHFPYQVHARRVAPDGGAGTRRRQLDRLLSPAAGRPGRPVMLG